MKKNYCTPTSIIYKVNTENCILAGSPQINTTSTANSNLGAGAAEYEELEDDYDY